MNANAFGALDTNRSQSQVGQARKLPVKVKMISKLLTVFLLCFIMLFLVLIQQGSYANTDWNFKFNQPPHYGSQMNISGPTQSAPMNASGPASVAPPPPPPTAAPMPPPPHPSAAAPMAPHSRSALQPNLSYNMPQPPMLQKVHPPASVSASQQFGHPGANAGLSMGFSSESFGLPPYVTEARSEFNHLTGFPHDHEQVQMTAGTATSSAGPQTQFTAENRGKATAFAPGPCCRYSPAAYEFMKFMDRFLQKLGESAPNKELMEEVFRQGVLGIVIGPSPAFKSQPRPRQ